MSTDLGGSFHRAAKWTPRVPRPLAAFRGPTTWKPRVPQTLGRFRVCRDIETASSPDLGSGFETPQVPETCELVCVVMETSSSPLWGIVENPAFPSRRKVRKPVVPSRAGHGNPKFPRVGRRRFRSWRDVETPGFPRLGRDLETPKLIAAGFGLARHGNPKFPRAWAPGHDLETPKCLRRAEPPNFRRDMETPSFPRLGRDLETPNFQRRAEQARHGNPKFPQAWAPGRDLETPNF